MRATIPSVPCTYNTRLTKINSVLVYVHEPAHGWMPLYCPWRPTQAGAILFSCIPSHAGSTGLRFLCTRAKPNSLRVRTPPVYVEHMCDLMVVNPRVYCRAAVTSTWEPDVILHPRLRQKRTMPPYALVAALSSATHATRISRPSHLDVRLRVMLDLKRDLIILLHLVWLRVACGN